MIVVDEIVIYQAYSSWEITDQYWCDSDKHKEGMIDNQWYWMAKWCQNNNDDNHEKNKQLVIMMITFIKIIMTNRRMIKNSVFLKKKKEKHSFFY